jgi:hypothetical protein
MKSDRISAFAVRPLAAIAVMLAAGGAASGQNVELPADSNAVSVLTFGAVPNDGGDDLAAFQAGLNALVGSNRTLYVPNGVYNFSDRLNWGGVNGGGGFTMQGQSKDGTILRLNANATGFGDPNTPKAFVDAYEGNTANQFRTYLRDITIEVGANNPGAIGLEFQSNNTGRIDNVTIRSIDPDRRGRTGLNQAFNFPGPLLMRNITIEGFEFGYTGAPQEYSAVFENLTLRNQRQFGISVWRLPVQIRNLVSENSVPVLRSSNNPGAWGHVVIDGGTFTGGLNTNDAIINEDGAGVIILRNVVTSGYRFAVNDMEVNGAPIQIPDGLVAWHTTDAPLSLNPSPITPVNLPIEDAPSSPDIPLAQWVSVKAFGAIENDNLDDTKAVQAAMNSGAPVVYFPSGLYYIAETINVGPSVRRIEGFNGNIAINAPLAMEGGGLFRIPPGSQSVVHINGFNGSFAGPGRNNGVWIEHATANTVVVRDGDISYRNTVPGGRVFLENTVGDNMIFTGQRVWARQLNPEGSGGTHIINDGGDMYVLGLKTEGDSTVFETRGRGRSVVMGGLIYPSTGIADRTRPMFINNESSLSFTVPESCYIANGTYGVWVREIRNGVSTDLPRNAIPRGHAPCGGMLSFYNGYRTDATPATTPPAPTVGTVTLNSIALSWPASTDAESGVARYNIYRNGVYYRAAMTPLLVDSGLPDGTSFDYRITSVNGAGIESPLGAVRGVSTLADTTPPRMLSVATGLDPRIVTIAFSEPVVPADATNVANYVISGPGGGAVTSATLAADQRTVTLRTSALSNGDYEIAVSSIADRSTAGNVIPAGTAAAFVYSGASAGVGLTGEYFASREFIGAPLLTRIDPQINFNYGTGSPAPGVVPVDNFAVRWTGQIKPRFSETYTIFVRSDDGARLFIDGVLAVGRWQDQPPTEISAQVVLDSSRTHDIVVEYYEAVGGAEVQLSWQSASQPKQIIPSQNLFPNALLRTVRTSFGAGADAQLQRFGTTDGGTGNSIGAFHSPASGGFHDAGYYRIDLTPFDLANNYVVDGVATLSQTFFGIGSGKRDINFFGVRQSANADNWIETGPGFVTWDTAVGNDNSGGLGNSTTSQFLATFRLDNANFQNNNQPDKASFSGDRLLDFLRQDTDGRVTMFMKRVDASNEGQSWFTKEWTSPSFAPSLRLHVVPRCPQILAQPRLVASPQLGQNLTLFVETQGAPTLSYQWRRNGTPLIDGPGAGGATINGANSASLLIAGAGCASGDLYDVVVSNACGSVTSAAVSLSVFCCPADFNGDGSADFFDYLDFVAAFDAEDPSADFNEDGGVDFFDYLDFVAAFDVGC